MQAKQQSSAARYNNKKYVYVDGKSRLITVQNDLTLVEEYLAVHNTVQLNIIENGP